jgi:hypothetical protein
MLRGELSEEERQTLEERFLEDDALFHELSREEEELLEAWEEGGLDSDTAHAVDSLVQTSTRVQTLVDVTLSLEETDVVRAAEGRPPAGPLQVVLAKRSLPWILWGVALGLGLVLAVVLFLQYRMVRLLNQLVSGMDAAASMSVSDPGSGPAPDTPPVGPLRLGATAVGEVEAPFDRTAGLTVEIVLERTLLPGSYFLELGKGDDERLANRIDLVLERSLFPGSPLRVVLPGPVLEPGSYRLSLFEQAAPDRPIVAWALQLVEA